jgi:regulator of sirC expression with transglutaminase-like and TPR domain
VVLRDLGHLEAAATDLRRYLELAPDAEDADAVRLRLQELTLGAQP